MGGLYRRILLPMLTQLTNSQPGKVRIIMATKHYNSFQEAVNVLHTLSTGTVISVDGRLMEVTKVNRVNTFKSMASQDMPAMRPNDGREFKKVHMASHAAYAVLGGA
jgi:hypothetical protein